LPGLVTGEYPGKGKKQTARSAPGLGTLPARQKDSVDGGPDVGRKTAKSERRKLSAWYHALKSEIGELKPT
jgi:hypothetical protein